MAALTRDEILTKNDVLTEKVDVPEWGGHVFVRSMSGSERDQYEQSLVQIKGKNRTVNLTNARAKLIALVTVNEQGEQMFSPADVERLGRKSSGALERLFNVAQRLSRLSEEDVEDLVGN